MMISRDVTTSNGRTVRAHDSGLADARLTIIWHHGSPQTGALLEPLLTAAAARGIRLLSYGRPSYGGSTPLRDRDVASAASDVAHIADAFDFERFAVMGASGGGPHALACAALLPDRVTGVATFAGLAPFDAAASVDWFAGMADPGSLQAAVRGVDARTTFEETAEFDPSSFNDLDYGILRGDWASLNADVAAAAAEGPEGLIDDDLAFVTPWGFDLGQVEAPALVVQGGWDRVIPASHAHWLVDHLPHAELRLRPAEGHVSILAECPAAMDWLLAHA